MSFIASSSVLAPMGESQGIIDLLVAGSRG